ncbi:MAG TPA: cytidylate kinase-like family protein [Desulfobacteraceae bacterium]|nr:cytidylate kinase-like family protein [Desulfobacteraceae bacterium]
MSVITISRQFGAGGRSLGKLVAERLGYTYVDNEIIRIIAKKAKVSPHWVESIEKEAGGRLSKFISSMVPKNLVARVLDDQRGYIDEEIYVDLLRRIIIDISKEGDAVIIGRGGQYILEGQPDVYSILIIGDKEYRAKFVEKGSELTYKQAVQAVNMDDKRRMNLYRQFGRQDYDDPALYHMVLNMSKLGVKKASDLVCKLVAK